jgi:hypothetical protein
MGEFRNRSPRVRTAACDCERCHALSAYLYFRFVKVPDGQDSAELAVAHLHLQRMRGEGCI